MNNRTELEQQLIQEIHTLPLEMIQAMLQLTLSVKKVTQDETDYLMRSDANHVRLLTAINNIENPENLVTVTLDEIADENNV